MPSRDVKKRTIVRRKAIGVDGDTLADVVAGQGNLCPVYALCSFKGGMVVRAGKVYFWSMASWRSCSAEPSRAEKNFRSMFSADFIITSLNLFS